jgi:hypothetical protein
VGIMIAWPVFTILTLPQGPVASQVFMLSQHFLPHALNFALALLIAPLLLSTLYLLVKDLDEPVKPAAIWPSTFFYLLYFTLVSISYGSQVLFKLLFLQPHTQLTTVLNWYFYQSPSLVTTLNQAGYLAYALATLILFIPLCSVKSTLLKSINLLLVVSALLQLAAALALFYGIPFLGHLTLLSGLLLLPTGILIHLYARSRSKARAGRIQL